MPDIYKGFKINVPWIEWRRLPIYEGNEEVGLVLDEDGSERIRAYENKLVVLADARAFSIRAVARCGRLKVGAYLVLDGIGEEKIQVSKVQVLRALKRRIEQALDA